MPIILRQLCILLAASGGGLLFRLYFGSAGPVLRFLHRLNTHGLLPLYLFLRISTIPVKGFSDCRVFIFAVVFLVALLIGGMVVLSGSADAFRSPVLLQGTLRGSATIYSAAMVQPLLPDALAGMAALAASLMSTFLSLLFLLVFLIYREKPEGASDIVRRSLLDPVLLAALLGLFCAFFELRLPSALCVPLETVTSVSAPLAFFLTATMITTTRLREDRRAVLWIGATRLLLVPATGLVIAALLDFDTYRLIILTPLLAAPCSVSGFSLAEYMKADFQLAGECLMVTQLAAPVTIAVLLYIIML